MLISRCTSRACALQSASGLYLHARASAACGWRRSEAHRKGVPAPRGPPQSASPFLSHNLQPQRRRASWANQRSIIPSTMSNLKPSIRRAPNSSTRMSSDGLFRIGAPTTSATIGHRRRLPQSGWRNLAGHAAGGSLFAGSRRYRGGHRCGRRTDRSAHLRVSRRAALPLPRHGRKCACSME